MSLLHATCVNQDRYLQCLNKNYNEKNINNSNIIIDNFWM
jgi:hypothetical protein